MAPVLQLRGISKSFPGVKANDKIDLDLGEGEILALLGENGAGKTTLMNILYGLYAPDEGEIYVRGERVDIRSPSEAIALGIGMVHQHFMLVPVFTVTENVILGTESVRAGVLLDRDGAAERIREISHRFGLDVDPGAVVENLPVGLQQRVEIIKVLYREADILILDEPTAVLTPQETEDLFGVIRSLVDQNKSVIFITHKLKEVLAISDRITVLRRGQCVGSAHPSEVTQADLARMMVGRDVLLEVEKAPAQPAEVVLDVRDVTVHDDLGHTAVKGLSLQVRAGEVLGIAGVQGNGQTELVEALTGLRSIDAGHVEIVGQTSTYASPRKVTEMGTAHVPEDRQRDGLVLSFSVKDNLVMNTYYAPPFAKGVVLQDDRIAAVAEERAKLFDVRTPSTLTPVANLSGGNQQKVIVAREFSRPIKLLIASQPTRGLDVGSVEYIHRRIIEKRDDGCAVLLVSSELDEIMSLSDRIAVMYGGQILATLPAEEATRERLGLLMAGVAEPEGAKAAGAGDQGAVIGEQRRPT
ncbi:MAG: ABC transporter ATP-binding protein [Anaerolineae bacterium]|nr:ABC transporter ATP-binding protein [Anaerolineae bacterium]